MKLRHALFIIGVMCGSLAGVILGQQPPAKYPITEIQQLKLQHKLDTVKLAQVAYQQAQSQMQSAYADLIAESQKVRAEDKFPESVKFDIGNLAFCDQLDAQGNCVAAPPAPPAPAPKAEKK